MIEKSEPLYIAGCTVRRARVCGSPCSWPLMPLVRWCKLTSKHDVAVYVVTGKKITARAMLVLAAI